MTRIRAALIATCALFAVVFNVSTPQASADNFFGWSYDVSVGSETGLNLTNVTYDGVKVFERISLPVMNVFYENNVCGPYTDKVGGNSYDGPFGSDFVLNGVQWRSIGLTDQIGQYEITMYYYLSENGDFDAHMFSRGLQCNNYHEHLPFWRMDIDLAGSANDQVYRATGNGNYAVETNEFSMAATAAVDHGWEVRDSATGDRLTIAFDTGTFSVPGVVVPESQYANNNVFGRQYRSDELTWSGGASRGLAGDGNEFMSDVVLWYSGFMPHSAAEGSALWHSTGIRLQVNPGNGGGGTATIGDRVTNSDGSGASGVVTDLFVQNGDGSRGNWLSSATTNANGNYGFTVDPGCYTVVFIAPGGGSFVGGGQYLERSTCVVAGGGDLSLDAVLAGGGGGNASIGNQVTFSGGGGASGVVVDLFSASADGSRAGWITSTTTGVDGSYSFSVAAGCYAVVFIAPNGQSFVNSGAYNQQALCVAAGETNNGIDAVLSSGGGGAGSIGDRVTRNGSGVSGVAVDVFTANGDGSRGAWLGDTTTDGNGNYGFSLNAGCYVVVFIAPNGQSFVNTGAYDEQYVCIAAGQTNNSIDATLL